MWCFFCGSFLLLIFRVCHAVFSVHCSLVVTCLKRANLLALLYVIFSCVFITFPCGVLGQEWCLIVSIPDICILPKIVMTEGLFFISEQSKKYILWSRKKVCDALHYLLGDIVFYSRSWFTHFNDWPPASDILSNKSLRTRIYFLIRFDSKLYRQIEDIPLCSNCFACIFCFCHLVVQIIIKLTYLISIILVLNKW